jgi:hypothetical protein
MVRLSNPRDAASTIGSSWMAVGRQCGLGLFPVAHHRSTGHMPGRWHRKVHSTVQYVAEAEPMLGPALHPRHADSLDMQYPVERRALVRS